MCPYGVARWPSRAGWFKIVLLKPPRNLEAVVEAPVHEVTLLDGAGAPAPTVQDARSSAREPQHEVGRHLPADM